MVCHSAAEPSPPQTEPTVTAIIVLANEGQRIFTKYYNNDFSTREAQLALEADIYAKSLRTVARVNSEILLLKKHIVLYKFVSDTYFYVLCGINENELIMSEVLKALEESVSTLLRHQVDKHSLNERLDMLVLAVDEIIDEGRILEVDPENISSRVLMKGMDSDMPIAEQSLKQAFQSAREQFVRSFR